MRNENLIANADTMSSYKLPVSHLSFYPQPPPLRLPSISQLDNARMAILAPLQLASSHWLSTYLSFKLTSLEELRMFELGFLELVLLRLMKL